MVKGEMANVAATSSRRGSALLIVLGMFSFMIVSAVAFCIYMRASRAPSSYVRRNASSRQLVKAALARAIDEIDTAIGNDPFPGVGYNHNYGGTGDRDAKSLKNDNWHGRVFTPSNEVAHSETVSTLTLEALGYLPASLVNEVRYWSRHSRTAKLHSLPYGLGQYAFTAVNVSDFFDLGTLAKKDNGGKTRRQYLNRSSSPHGRISPSYLFRNDMNANCKSKMGDSGVQGKAEGFLKALADDGKDPKDIPPVSLMDFNLSYKDRSWATKFPFLNNDSDFFGTKIIPEDDARRQLFIAGGWSGDTNQNSLASFQSRGIINLRYPEAQPFKDLNLTKGSDKEQDVKLNDVLNVDDSYFWNGNCIGFWAMPTLSAALLCDYLDRNSVPISLCVPCVEAVPMICSVEVAGGVTYSTIFDVVVTPGQPTGDGGTTPTVVTHTYKLKVDVNNLQTTVMTAFPFMNREPGRFTVDAFARVFFTENQGPAYNSSRSKMDSLCLDETFKWNVSDEPTSGTIIQKGKHLEYVQVNCGSRDITFDKMPLGENPIARDALQYPIDVRGGNAGFEIELAKIEYEVKDGSATVKSSDGMNSPADLVFYDQSGAEAGINFLNEFQSGAGATKFRPSVAVWVRIRDENNKVVDMVPATHLNDQGLNDFPATGNGFCYATSGANDKADMVSNVKIPILRFREDDKGTAPGIILTQGAFGFQSGVSVDKQKSITQDYTPVWEQKVYYALDPRINWAPEHWWADSSKNGNTENTWLESIWEFQNSHYWSDSVDDRARDNPDIFMAVSDQGYLQSMYELMMLPQPRRILPKGEDTNADWGEFQRQPNVAYSGVVKISDGLSGILPDIKKQDFDASGDFANGNVMWRTYRSEAFFPKEGVKGARGDNTGGLNNWGRIEDFPFVEPENGLRVNPYTDNTNIMMAAFANMPNGWYAAGTNELVLPYMAPESGKFNTENLFKWSYDENDTVYNIAAYWMKAFHGESPVNTDWDREQLHEADVWEDIFEDSDHVFDWCAGDYVYKPAGLDYNILDKVLDESFSTSVDRKFMYGYLKGCFANRSQLFLIFVRADPAAGGGGAASGARAVALVWRDPLPPMDVASGQYIAANGGKENAAANHGNAGKDNAQWYLNTPNKVEDEMWRLNERDYPPHRTRILFYHQLD